ncbi:retinoic acid receptor RXR-beta-A-like isoform X2 [Sycon ciliatum]|uniref:retinoic acid receptor RXR-beta-A-like isoform X2 n=1 Tax=Sycon ciliatum TaxID=27933 RepID=UPI0031F6DA12
MQGAMQSDSQRQPGSVHQSVGLPTSGNTTTWETPSHALSASSTMQQQQQQQQASDAPYAAASSPAMSMSTANSSPPTPMSHGPPSNAPTNDQHGQQHVLGGPMMHDTPMGSGGNSSMDMHNHQGYDEKVNVNAAQVAGVGGDLHGQPYDDKLAGDGQQYAGDKLCLVCGDDALGRHFGVLTCEACKSFFRRSVRQSAQYFCRYNRNCAVQKNNRNKCQYCRYQKCVAVGMQIDDVRTPIKPLRDGVPVGGPMGGMGQSPLTGATAVNPHYYSQQPPMLYQNMQWNPTSMQPASMQATGMPPPQSPQQQQLQQQQQTSQQAAQAAQPQGGVMPQSSAVVQMLEQPTPLPIPSPSGGGPAPQRIISLPILLQAERAWPGEQPIPLDNTITQNSGNFDDVIKSTRDQLYFAIEWAKMVPPFTELTIEDQVSVLKSVWNELLTLRLAFRPSPVEDALLLGTGKLLFRDKGDPEMMRIVGRFLDEIVTPCKMMNLEMAELVCMKALVLFNPDCPKILQRTRVERIQEQCMEMLGEYCRARFPTQKLRFSKILLRLSAVRSITTETRDYLVQRKSQGNINIDSFVLEMLGDT